MLDGIIGDFSEWFTEDVSSHNLMSISGEVPADVALVQSSSLVLPADNMEVDDQLVILHLLKAYGDAMGREKIELAEEIIRRLKVKASPTGKSPERLAFYLTLALDKQANYIMQETSKNYEAAFNAFYQIFPHGTFAHFTANSAILEAIPADDAKLVHVVDFDIGNGIQWPPLIEALGRERTKKQLCGHAMKFGLRLEMEEMDMDMDMEGLVRNIKMASERRGISEWLAFNCMAGLPRMGKGRSLKHVKDFLTTAKALICSTDRNSHRGVITLEQMVYFQSLLESMEQFQLLEARIAMECLFVAPHISSLANAPRECGCLTELGLEPCRMSLENYMEARGLVREGESSYWVRTEGEDNNQMVLSYIGAPLVRVSSWR
ncbi:hypothetical protein PTKIN_Ptkin11bG0005100 [Pterospermum kingtungense]